MEDGAAFWLGLAAIVVAAIYFRHARTLSRHQVLQAMIEKGQPISTEIFDERNSHRGLGVRQAFLAGGIVLIGLSCGLLVLLTTLHLSGEADEKFLPAIAAIPFSLGVACLVVNRFLKPND